MLHDSITFFNHSPTKTDKKDALDDSNMRLQCPKMERETVDVEMLEEPRTDEDALVGSSLRRSSQKAYHKATGNLRS